MSLGLLKKRRVKKVVLEIAAKTEPGRYTRVSDSCLEQLEAACEREIHKILNAPQWGKTIRGHTIISK